MKTLLISKNPDSPNKFTKYLVSSYQWFLNTPERALCEAYNAVLAIKNLEHEHFDGKKICAESSKYSSTVISYFHSELYRNLNSVKFRLAEFRASSLFLKISDSVILEKLEFIDAAIGKYLNKDKNSLALLQPRESPGEINLGTLDKLPNPQTALETIPFEDIADKTGVLPRSIGRTINRIRTELDPKAEEKFIAQVRKTRNKIKVALRFLVMLIIIPLLTQQLSKTFIINPLVEWIRGEKEISVFLTLEMKEEALRELQSFEEELRFENLINIEHQIAPEIIEQKVQHKAVEIAEEFHQKSRTAVSNVFADLLGLIAFSLIIVTNKQEIIVVKSFIDDIIYGLSDSAKAFIIILSTDIFVGYHSSHGWEVLLEAISTHLGIAANKTFIFVFIATFPVILDAIFKYWIFRYLSRISPSAVATLRNMNE